MYDFRIFTGIDSLIYGFIRNQRNNQLLACLLAQLIEHYTSILEVMGSNPVQALFSLNVHYQVTKFYIFTWTWTVHENLENLRI